jgi:23S rRNA pseudouridine1911/1915/1917 synthase
MPTSHTVGQPSELLAFLFACHPDVKRTKVRQWLKHGAVHINGRPVTRTNHPLQVGDRVSIAGRDQARTHTAPPRGIRIVFEDDWLIVIEKPAKLLSMASAGERQRTAYALLTDYVRGGNPRSPSRVWIVHRLDRETSGLMVFAKTEEAKRALQADWQQTVKRYLAIVEGHPPSDEGELRSHLDERNPLKVYGNAEGKGTRQAVTRYRTLRKGTDWALLELLLETGRRHQIRVQLADAGCPVVGDAAYQAATDPVGRLALHASELQFRHPHSGQPLHFQSRLPRRLARLQKDG